MIRWGLVYSREATQSIYRIPRGLARNVTDAIYQLTLEPLPPTAQPDEDDPSKYWIAVEGDYVIMYEILDETHQIRVVDVE